MKAALTSILISVLQHFQIAGTFLVALPYGDGHINDTYLARFREPDGHVRSYILQRINQDVFKKPEEVMHNIERVTAHIMRSAAAAGEDPARNTLTLVPTRQGVSYHLAASGDCWRVNHFILGAQTYPRARNLQHYYQAAKTFGEFLRLLDDFPIGDLFETIPDFHHTPKRYRALMEAIDRDPLNRRQTVEAEIEFVVRREMETGILVDLVERGILPRRVTHNDTKIDNVMIDDQSGEGVCVIDLDTVMPGLAVFDFGDAVRSGANPAAEDEPDLSKVVFDLAVFDSLAHGFLDATRDLLTPVEVEHLAFGAKLITFEQGIRFLGDYLNGDLYYKTSRPHHNLDRARTQLKLVADMEALFGNMQAIIAKYWDA